jgi:hypothetical protein
MAVDVTVIDPQGVEIDMGSGFDEMAEKIASGTGRKMLAAGQITAQQRSNRGYCGKRCFMRVSEALTANGGISISVILLSFARLICG